MFLGPMFPSGAAGLALLTGRLAAAAVLTLVLREAAFAAVWSAVLLVLVASCLATGLLTRLMAVACAALVAFAASRAGGMLAGVLTLNALQVAALILTGAGAYSLDARLFGRRVIRLDD